MNLSKSRFCSGIQCKKKLWLEINRPEEKEDLGNDGVLENGTEVGAKAREYFGKYIEIPFSENLNEMVEETKKTLNDGYSVIAEASFVYGDNFCSVDILKNDTDGIEVFEVKSSTEVKEIYKYDLAYQVYILLNLGYKIKKAFIMHINSEYIRKGSLDLKGLFTIDDITIEVLDMQPEITQEINTIKKEVETKEEPIIDIGPHCVKHYKCPFFKYCSRHLPDNNVFNLRGLRDSTKFNLYKSGCYSYVDLLNSNIDSKYKQQIEYEMNELQDYIDKDAVKTFLGTLSYPLYFLDFETYQQAIPEFDDVKPYMQIPFQYSLHYIIDKAPSLEHTEFLADSTGDPRRALAEKLVHDIPKDTCVIAYNMMFEKMVIKNLANLYSDLKEHLMNIYDNMHDLMIPFKNREVYTKDMHGSYSIKYVLPALFPNDANLDYHNLDLIHNGSEAMTSFKELSKMDKGEQEETRRCLLKYCELDTYAMVKIWEWLNNVTQK